MQKGEIMSKNKRLFEFKINEFMINGRLDLSYPTSDIIYPLTQANLVRQERSATINIKGELLNYLSELLGKKIYRASVHVSFAEKNYIFWMSFEFDNDFSFSTKINYGPMADRDRETTNKHFKDIIFTITEEDVEPLRAIQKKNNELEAKEKIEPKTAA
jgi:hypothetical protein